MYEYAEICYAKMRVSTCLNYIVVVFRYASFAKEKGRIKEKHGGVKTIRTEEMFISYMIYHNIDVKCCIIISIK